MFIYKEVFEKATVKVIEIVLSKRCQRCRCRRFSLWILRLYGFQFWSLPVGRGVPTFGLCWDVVMCLVLYWWGFM